MIRIHILFKPLTNFVNLTKLSNCSESYSIFVNREWNYCEDYTKSHIKHALQIIIT